MQITIDPGFKRQIPSLLPDEFLQLEANILRDGCQEPLTLWKHDGKDVLVDGHNRHTICQTHNKPFKTSHIKLIDRDHAELWINEHQLGRRNLSDDQRAVVASNTLEKRSDIARKERAVKAGEIRPRISTTTNKRDSLEDTTTTKLSAVDSTKPASKERNRTVIAKETKLSERKVRSAQEIKKAAPEVSDMVLAGKVSLIEGKKLSVLEAPARKVAITAVKSGTDVRTAIRQVKKETYNVAVQAAKPKKLEGKYRIIYADPPWKYVGLNQMDEHGHAERHYDSLDDVQLMGYKVGGTRLVKEVTDSNAVLFLWVTSPLLERCFPIIKAWGFDYKSSFVWDKMKHNMGHYNSVRHELLLICTKGSCKPDVPKLVDSVQSIERSSRHSEKPEEFRKIIEALYDHGRKLELFRRGDAPKGWDTDGNES